MSSSRAAAESYDNTQALGASTWRHVLFLTGAVNQFGLPAAKSRSLAVCLSDVCKHLSMPDAWKRVPQARSWTKLGACVLSNPTSVTVTNRVGLLQMSKRPSVDGRAFGAFLL